MIGFLVGKRMYDTNYVTQDDLDLVKNAIRNIDIKVGIFEEYAKSLSYFSKFSNIKWPKKIEVKRITLNRPLVEEISEETKTLIVNNNALDLALYEYALDIFFEKTRSISKKNILFKGNKYDYVLKFTQRFNILETTLTNLEFLKINSSFFENLNNHLHHRLKVKNGEDYVKLWNEALIRALETNCLDTSLTKDILKNATNEDPLLRNIQIGNCINRNFKATPKNIKLFKNKLHLDTKKIILKSKKFKWF